MVIIKQINKKKLNKNDPLIIKYKAIGANIIELNILLINSLFIKFFQNFF
tara:strand:- start:475 stop:624 length:150 start_codon:yes stop_codon:yes gene_type:complete